MNRHKRVAVAAAAALVLAGVTTTGITVASAQARPGDQPPECVPVTVGAYQADGTLAKVHLVWCGEPGGGDSPMHDSAAHHLFILDGARGVGHGCGTAAQPCVIFPSG